MTIKVLRTEPSVSVEKRCLSVIGQFTTNVRTNLDKYSEILSYHPNPWSINGISDETVIHHFIINETNVDEFIKHFTKHSKCLRDIFITDTVEDKVKEAIDNFNKVIGLVSKDKLNPNLIRLGALQNAMPHYFATTKNKPIAKVKIHEFVYPLAMSFIRTNVYHFDTTPEFTYPQPEHTVIFGKINSYHQHTNIEDFNKHFAPVFLIQQYYVPETTVRRKEINYCLKKNVSSKIFNKIILLNEKLYDKYDCNVMNDPVIHQVVTKKRLTYYDVIQYAKHNLPKYSYIILSNSDIYLNNTIQSIFRINMEKTFLALLRFDLKGDLYDKEYQNIHLFGPRNDSQDTWIWQNTPDIFDDPAINFPLGKKGCDNAITAAFLRHKYRVLNPALSIQTIHVHMSEQRTYNKNEIIAYPIYLLVKPHTINTFNTITDMKEHTIFEGKTSQEFNINYPHYSQEIRTFMHYAKKKHGNSPEFNQPYTVKPYNYQKINAFSGVFLNNRGLVYNRNNIYQYSQHAKFNDDVSLIIKTNIHKQAVNFVIPEKLNLISFLTKVYPKLLMLASSSLKEHPFIIKYKPEFKKYIEPLTKVINIVPSIDSIIHFAHKLYCPELVPDLSWNKEYSTIIRKHIEEHKRPEEYMNVLLVRDPEFYDTEESWSQFTDNIKTQFGDKFTYNEIVSTPENYFSSIQLFKTASIVVGHRCDIMGNIVFCTKGCHIIEIAYESTPDLSLWNISGASEFNYTLIAYKREPKERQFYMINKKLNQALENNPFPIKPIPLLDFRELKKTLMNDNDDDSITNTIQEKEIIIKVNKNTKKTLQPYINYWKAHNNQFSIIEEDISCCLVNDKPFDLPIYSNIETDLKISEKKIPIENRTIYYDSPNKFNLNSTFVNIYSPHHLLTCLANASIPVISETRAEKILKHPVFKYIDTSRIPTYKNETSLKRLINMNKDNIKKISHVSYKLWENSYSPRIVWKKIKNSLLS